MSFWKVVVWPSYLTLCVIPESTLKNVSWMQHRSSPPSQLMVWTLPSLIDKDLHYSSYYDTAATRRAGCVHSPPLVGTISRKRSYPKFGCKTIKKCRWGWYVTTHKRRICRHRLLIHRLGLNKSIILERGGAQILIKLVKESRVKPILVNAAAGLAALSVEGTKIKPVRSSD